MAPAFRMHPAPAHAAYTSRGGHAQLLRKRPMNGSTQRRRRVLANVKKRAKEISRKLPSVKDVNKIDQYSRMFFPSLFIVFNICYWSYYLLQWSRRSRNHLRDCWCDTSRPTRVSCRLAVDVDMLIDSGILTWNRTVLLSRLYIGRTYVLLNLQTANIAATNTWVDKSCICVSSLCK